MSIHKAILENIKKESTPTLSVDLGNTMKIFNEYNSGTRRWDTVNSLSYLLNGNTIPFPSQVKKATTTSGKNTTSSTYVATNLSSTFTPTTTTSSVLLMASATIDVSGTNKEIFATLARDGNNLMAANGGLWLFSPSALEYTVPCTLIYLDVPGTTSQVTYDVRIKNNDGATTVTWGQGETQVLIMIEFLT